MKQRQFGKTEHKDTKSDVFFTALFIVAIVSVLQNGSENVVSAMLPSKKQGFVYNSFDNEMRCVFKLYGRLMHFSAISTLEKNQFVTLPPKWLVKT